MRGDSFNNTCIFYSYTSPANENHITRIIHGEKVVLPSDVIMEPKRETNLRCILKCKRISVIESIKERMHSENTGNKEIKRGWGL